MTDAAWLTPVLDAAAMREADRWAIDEQGIPSLELMETAGEALGEAVVGLGPEGPIRVLCGKGNNGGDGIVAARLLAERGFEVEVLLLWPAEELRPDARANLERWHGKTRELGSGEAAGALRGSAAVVDAIFGTGFDGEPREPALAAIEALNASGSPVVAADIASGVDASTGVVAGAAVRATATVSFHAAKVGHYVAPGKAHTGRLEVVPIGIPAGAPGRAAAGLIGPGVLADLPRRGPASSKFSSGHVLVVGGSRGMTGAVCLAAQAAARAGAGYVAAGVPAPLEQILETKLTEVMTLGLAEGESGGLGPAALEPVLKRAEGTSCLVLGPGLGRSEPAAALARELVSRLEVPLLIDADGLNALGDGLERARADRPRVLTPHAGELARLLSTDSSAVGAARLESAREAASRSGSIVVLKGDDTIVTDGERVAINSLSSPALATAGTGDVLSGVIAALIARGADPFEAACAGVLAHARAGRIAAERIGANELVIASDVIEALPGGLEAG